LGSASTETASKLREFAFGLLLALLSLSIWAPLVPVEFGLSDEGWLLTAIDRLAAGERLYTDIYRSYAPGTYWLFAALDADLVTIRWVWLVGLVLLSVGGYRLARPHMPLALAVGVGLVPVLLRPPLHKVFVPLCYLAALGLCHQLATRENAGARRLLALGVGFGLIGLFRQEAAAFGLLIGLVTMLLRPSGSAPLGLGTRAAIARAGWLSAGVALLWTPVIAYLWMDGALGAAVEQLVLTGARGNAAMSLPFPSPLQLLTGPGRIGAALLYLPGVAVLLGGWATRRAWLDAPGSSLALVLAQWTSMALLSHAVFASRTDLAHLLQALVAPTLILGFVAGVALRAPTPRGRWMARSGVAFLGIGLLVAPLPYGDLSRQYALRREGVPFRVRGQELTVPARHAAVYDRLVSAIHVITKPGEPIFVVPYSPGLYYLAERPNPTRHGAVLPGYASDEILAEIVAALERTETRLIVFERIAYDGQSERALPVFAPELSAYFSERYVQIERIGNFTLLRRRS
jgi:hypothetical protein